MSSEVTVVFYGGPHDGEEKTLALPLGELIERKAEPVRERREDVVVAMVTVVHLYVLQADRRKGKYIYQYQGDRIEREEVE